MAYLVFVCVIGDLSVSSLGPTRSTANFFCSPQGNTVCS